MSWALCAIGLGVVLDLRGVGMRVVYFGKAFFGSSYLIALLLFARSGHATELRNHDGSNDPKETQVEEAANGPQDYGDAETDAPTGIEETATAQQSLLPGPGLTSTSMLVVYYRILTRGGLKTVMFFNLLLWLYPGLSLGENLLFLYFKNELHASHTFGGMTVVIAVIFQVLLFAQAPNL